MRIRFPANQSLAMVSADPKISLMILSQCPVSPGRDSIGSSKTLHSRIIDLAEWSAGRRW